MLSVPFIAEFLATFFFLSTILISGEPIQIAAALLAAIAIAGPLSGGHLNPAVSTAFFMKGDLPLGKFGGYVVAQILGAIAAITFSNYVKKNRA
jgi:aquaporin Z